MKKLIKTGLMWHYFIPHGNWLPTAVLTGLYDS